MAWSYSGNPSSSMLDRLRFEIQDTSSEDPLLSDEELTFLLTNYTIYRAAAKACLAIAMKFAKLADKRIGPISISAGERAEKYLQLADKFSRRYLIGEPYSGNMSKDDESSDVTNKDLKQPKFWKDMMTNE